MAELSKPARRRRERLRDVRALMREADRCSGRKRERVLLQACRAYVKIGIPANEERAFRRASWAVELVLGRMVNDCIGCVAEHGLRRTCQPRSGR